MPHCSLRIGRYFPLLVATSIVAPSLLCVHPRAAAQSAALPLSATDVRTVVSAPTAAPAQDQPIFLIYRAAPAPLGQRDTVSALVCSDHSGAVLHLRLIASGGQAQVADSQIPGSDSDNEPTWPQWISPAIALDFRGWKKIDFPISEFTYRAPIGQSPTDAPKLSTVDAFGIDMPDSGETVLLDNLTWLSASGSPAPIIVDNFESGDSAAWSPHGTPETMQDAQVSLVTDRARVEAGRVAFEVSFAAAKLARTQALAVMHRDLDASHADYLTYVPASPFRRILPSSLPLPDETAQPISLFACDNQTESGSFCVYADRDLTGVTVVPATDFEALGHTIDRSSIDIRVVDVWTRQGIGKYRDADATGPTPELLVKDDRAPIDFAAGEPPQVRLTGDPVTNIPAGTTKQFWVTVHVPDGALPGHYSAELEVRGPAIRPSRVTLQLEVLPMRLYDPAKQYVMGLDCDEASSGQSDGGADGIETLDPASFAADLADVHNHGFLCATVGGSPTQLWSTYPALRSASLGSPLIYDGLSGQSATDVAESDAIQSQLRSAGIDSVAYLAPTGDDTLADLTALHKDRRTTAAFVRTDSQFQAEQAVLDMPIYSVNEPYVQQLLRTDGLRTSNKYDYWYWPAYEDNPQVNRLYAGYLLYRANLYGAYVPDYREPFQPDPYSDQPSPGDSPDRGILNHDMLTYPVEGGVLDTIQWEAVLAGVNDMRYLTTYFAALRECKDNHVASTLVAQFEPQVKEMMSKAFWVMDDSQYQQARRVIAHDTVLLRESLNKFYAHGGANPLTANAATPHPVPSRKKAG